MDILNGNRDISKNAYLNWRFRGPCLETEDNLVEMANNYSIAVNILIDEILSDNKDKKADGLIFPILFSINLVIELYLKAIIRLTQMINNTESQKHKTHNINQLFDEMSKELKISESEKKEFDDNVACVKNYIEVICEKIFVTENSDNDNNHFQKTNKPKNHGCQLDEFRYPVDTKYKPYFYVNEENITIDIEKLKTCFSQINSCLNGLYQMQLHKNNKSC